MTALHKILQYLSRARKPVTTAQIARHTKLPRTTVYSALNRRLTTQPVAKRPNETVAYLWGRWYLVHQHTNLRQTCPITGRYVNAWYVYRLAKGRR